MGLESLLARLKNDVADVSDVQPNIHAGLSCNVIETADVADVAAHDLTAISATSATAAKNQTFQPEPAWNKACTSATAETCKKINAEPGFSAATQKVATLDPTPAPAKVQAMPPADCASGSVIDIGTVRPAGLSAKLLAASQALDAKVQAAGLSLGDDSDRHCWPNSTAMNGAELATFTARLARFSTKGVTHADAESLADRLVQRDRDSDDRRLCLECRHLSGYGASSWRCRNWQAAGVAIRSRDTQLPADLVLQLQRCDGFYE
jgi:hypothetical protein